jgi:hypothetical protein
MLRKLLVCVGAAFVLTVAAALYSAGIPTDRRNADEAFESVAKELTEASEGNPGGNP